MLAVEKISFLGVTGKTVAAEFAEFRVDGRRFRDGVRVFSESANAGRLPTSGLEKAVEDNVVANISGGGGSRFDL